MMYLIIAAALLVGVALGVGFGRRKRPSMGEVLDQMAAGVPGPPLTFAAKNHLVYVIAREIRLLKEGIDDG